MKIHRVMKRAAALLLIAVAAGGAGLGISARSTPPEPGRQRFGGRGRQSIPHVAQERRDGRGGRRLDASNRSEHVVEAGRFPARRAPADRSSPRPACTRARKRGSSCCVCPESTKDDNFRWLPTQFRLLLGGRPSKNGQKVPELEYYEATFRRDLADCEVKVRLAAGSWKTEVSNDGSGGSGVFVNGHKFSFGKARPLTEHGRPMTVFAVAHNFFGQDRRLVAIDRDGKWHAAVSYSLGSDGDPKWLVDLIDAEIPVASGSDQGIPGSVPPVRTRRDQGHLAQSAL